MCLLQDTKDNLTFEYSLPLGFEKQLSFIDRFIACEEDGMIQFSRAWELVKSNIHVYETIEQREITIYKNGVVANASYEDKMLGYATKVVKMLSKKMMVFMKERGME